MTRDEPERLAAFVALLRGVNVGKAKRVPMAGLRALLSGLGYTDVATLLNSGNAVFRSAESSPARHASAIAGAIADRMKIDVPVVVKSAIELEAIVAGNPLARSDADPSRLLVAFAPDSVSLKKLEPVRSLVARPERFELGPHAAYFYCPAGILESAAWKALVGKAGATCTTRNWATVLRLRRMAAERSAEARAAGSRGEPAARPAGASRRRPRTPRRRSST